MKALIGLIPLAIGIGAIGAVTLVALTGGWALGPWLLAGLLFAHGLIHLMFVAPQPEPATIRADEAAWPFDMRRSWLIGGPGLDVGLVRSVGIGLVAIVLVGFVLGALATIDVLVPAEWWPGLVIGAAGGSTLLLTLFYSPQLLLGYAIDLMLLWLVVASVWSPTTALP